jgi:hypothetical protein
MYSIMRYIYFLLLLIKLTTVYCECRKDVNSTFLSTTANLLPITSPISNLFTVSGVVTLLDYCSFRIDNYTLKGVTPNMYWYAQDHEFYGESINATLHEEHGTSRIYNLTGQNTFERFRTIYLIAPEFDSSEAYIGIVRFTTVKADPITTASPKETLTPSKGHTRRFNSSLFLSSSIATIIMLSNLF